MHPIGPGSPENRPAPRKIEAAAPPETGNRVQVVWGLFKLRLRVLSARSSSPTRAQLFPNSWTLVPVHAFSETHRTFPAGLTILFLTPSSLSPVEHMIQKNQCLFTNTQCKVCCALLISESQKLAHYQSKKHANKVKRYLAIHGMETLKGETKKLDSDQKSSRSKDKNQCCPICNMTFSSPVVAQSHYLGKTHAKNLKLKQQSTKVEALHQNREMIDPDKFCSLCHATFNDPVMAQQHYVGKKHRKQETKLKLMAHYGRLADPAVTDSSAGKGYPCKTCKIVLNSIEQYQAHVSGFKHKNQSPKTMVSPLGQIPMQRQPIQKDSTALED
ncbi:zinc finger protein 346 isoform X2 [Pteropus alecto]|uniref:zinc finger protein 346 isoform X2 n=1 Tax=Pteropus alecto TaxID=9402 RepID=UPI000D53BAA5|nr:zinc finger protein 346 isoform X2 [Pteropus alecto]